MNKLILTTCVFSILLSGCKNPFEAKDKGIDQLNTIENRWEDTQILASSTARIALATPISELQEIRRDLKKSEVSECLTPAKEALISYMDSRISNFLNFMSETESTYFEINPKIIEYFSIKNKCTGEQSDPNSILAKEAKEAEEYEAKVNAEMKKLGFDIKEKGTPAYKAARVAAEAAIAVKEARIAVAEASIAAEEVAAEAEARAELLY